MSASKSRVASISAFIQRIKEIESRKGFSLFYRGHSDAAYKAIPSVFRSITNGGTVGTYADQEDNLFKNMVIQCPQEFIGCSSTLEYLVKMQHYGLPTRLLDLTTNPLVALYFACSSQYGKGGKNGEVIIYEVPNEDIKFFNSDTAAVIGNLAKMPRNFNYQNDKSRFLHEIQAEKPYFKDAIKVDDLTKVQCVKAKLDNRRITQQSGAFFIFGMGAKITDPATIPYPYIYKKDNAPVSIEITHAGKKLILSELANLSISEASLFPEIDSVARHLKSQVVDAL
jgi:hypothetical protein